MPQKFFHRHVASNEALPRMLFSYYKNHHTAKVLVSMAPTEHVIYATSPYGGRISDNDLTAEYACIFETLCVLVLFSEEEKLVIKEVASTRMYVERVIRKAKIFKILTDEVPIPVLKYYDMVVQICFGLTNYMNRLVINDISDLFTEQS
eukprot:Pgem_evm1s12251